MRSSAYDTKLVDCIEFLKRWHLTTYRKQIDEDTMQESLKKALEDEYSYPVETKYILNFLILKYKHEQYEKRDYYERHPVSDCECKELDSCSCNYDLKVISKIINKLPEKQRRLITLTAKGYKVNEIAEITKRTANGIKSQLYKIRKHLAQAIL